MKHKKFALFLAAATTLTLTFAMPASAEESSVIDADSLDEDSSEEVTYTSGDFEYTLTEDGNASISRYVGSDTEVTIPTQLDSYTVTDLGGGCFAQITSIVSVTLPETLETVQDSCFFGCSSLETIAVEDGNDAFAVADGVLFSADGRDLILYPPAAAETSYTVPDGVVEIWSSAFAQTSLTSVTFPDSLLYVDDWAFAWASLDSLELPDSVTEMGQYAFAYCTRLTEVTLPASLELIEAAAFAGCSNLEKVELPDGLSEVQMAAFAGTAMKEVTIPSSVSAIGFCAFGYEEDMETPVDGFVVYGTVGSQAQTYCTDSDSENNYSNSFTFRSVMSEEVESEDTAVQVESKETSPWQQYGKWILLGVGALVLLIGGLLLIFGGKGKKSEKPAKKSDKKAKAKKEAAAVSQEPEASPAPEAAPAQADEKPESEEQPAADEETE
ncbi:MAG: leucine-rich repeat domain-containing protein [Ruminococcus sp.]